MPEQPNALKEAMARIMGAPVGGAPEAPERNTDPRWADWASNTRPIIYGTLASALGTSSGIGNTPGTAATAEGNKAAPKLPFNMTQAEYDAPDYQAALAASGDGSVYRTQTPGAYAATSTPNAMGGYHTVVKRGPSSWGAWTAGTAPATPVYNAAHWESERAAANAVLAAENKRLGIGQKTTPVRTGGFSISGIHNTSGWKPRDMSGYKPR
jgi:hypothetical protein